MLCELYRKRFEENRGNRKLCHLNPFDFFDQSRRVLIYSSISLNLASHSGSFISLACWLF